MDRRRILLIVAVIVAALGAGLVFWYAQGAEDRARDQLATTEVLVATDTIRPGEAFTEAAATGKLIVKAVPQEALVGGATSSDAGFLDKVALTTIYPNEQLVAEKFGTAEEINAPRTLPVPKGKLGITIEVGDVNRVGAFTRPGSRVRLFATANDGVAPGAEGTEGTTGQGSEFRTGETRVLFPNIQILAVGSTTVEQQFDEEGNPISTGLEETPTTYFSIAVTEAQAATIRDAEKTNTLSFGLLSNSAGQGSDDTTGDDEAGSEPGQ